MVEGLPFGWEGQAAASDAATGREKLGDGKSRLRSVSMWIRVSRWGFSIIRMLGSRLEGSKRVVQGVLEMEEYLSRSTENEVALS